MTDLHTQAVLNALAAQRNEALNAVANLVGDIAILQAKVAELEAALKPRAAE